VKTIDLPYRTGWVGWLRDLANAGGTGGLNWHVHAAQSLNRWLPTRELIAQFLAQVQPTQNHLVLIGCSSGWMLPTPWLARFKTIEVYDIDPLVPFLFGLRHGNRLKAQGVTLRFHRCDAIAGLPNLLKQHPDACWWFDNVLGQLGFRLGDEDMAERQLRQLKSMLHGRAWGSLHDVYSGPIDPQLSLPACEAVQWMRLDDHPEAQAQVKMNQQTLSHADAAQALLGRLNATGVWHDHATQEVFEKGTLTTLLPWAFKPRYWHWLQAAWVKS
jgi:hypothetical protein